MAPISKEGATPDHKIAYRCNGGYMQKQKKKSWS